MPIVGYLHPFLINTSIMEAKHQMIKCSYHYATDNDMFHGNSSKKKPSKLWKKILKKEIEDMDLENKLNHLPFYFEF